MATTPTQLIERFYHEVWNKGDEAAAHQVVALIGKLYAVERELYDRSSAERKAAREDRSRPILDKIKTWLDEDALLPHRDGQG